MNTNRVEKPKSCGAILYSFDEQGHIGIILGKENNIWSAFKGCRKNGEDNTYTSIREITEETCGVFKPDINDVLIPDRFVSKTKIYYISLLYTDYSIIQKFNEARENEKNGLNRKDFLEKIHIRFFKLSELENLINTDRSFLFDKITKKMIAFYYPRLIKIEFDSHCNNMYDNTTGINNTHGTNSIHTGSHNYNNTRGRYNVDKERKRENSEERNIVIRALFNNKKKTNNDYNNVSKNTDNYIRMCHSQLTKCDWRTYMITY